MIEQWLSQEEKHQLDVLMGDLVNHHMGTEFVFELAKSLTASRELMKKHEDASQTGRCVECKEHINQGCRPDCAWTKQLAGLPRRIETEEPPESEV